MRRRQTAGLFLIVNVVVSLVVALLAIQFYNSTQQEAAPRARPTFIVVVTATPDGNFIMAPADMQSTIDSLKLTVTAFENVVSTQDAGGVIPTQAPTVPDRTGEVLPTLDPSLIPGVPGAGSQSNSTLAPPVATSEDGCIRHIVASGDVASAIATRYEVSLEDLFSLNGIDEFTILQIGQELLIPGPDCEPELNPTASPTPRATFNLTLVAPTVTLQPTAANAQIAITQILNHGDITTEQVEIQNLGGEINLSGWTLTDSQGNTYTFPEMRLVQGSLIRVLTRSGIDTPGFLYWNQNTPIWELGETASLYDPAGTLQSVATVGGEIIDLESGDGN